MQCLLITLRFICNHKLLTSIKYNKQHILHSLLPSTMNTKYNLRPRPHNFKLTTKYCLILNVILLPGCFLKTFIDFMFFCEFILCINFAI